MRTTNLAGRTALRPARLVFWAAAALAGCSGSIEAGAGDPGNPALGDTSTPPPKTPASADGTAKEGTQGSPAPGPTGGPPLAAARARVRRLSGEEINNTVSDLLLGGASPTRPLQREVFAHGFDNEYGNLGVQLGLVEDLQALAEDAASKVVASLPRLVPCDASVKGEAACAGQAIEELGLSIYRRPVAADEKADLLAAFTEARKAVGYADAVGATVEAMLQSPNFLFRTELGEPGKAKVTRLAPYEVASALSYFLWRSAPDRALLEAARTRELAGPAGIAAQVDRMLKDPRARRGARSFLMQWLELHDPDRVSKDPAVLRGWSAQLAPAFYREAELFLEDLIWSGKGTLEALLTSTSSFANAETAKIYGLSGIAGAELRRVELDGVRRAGLLTQPALLATHMPGSVFTPIGLGLFVRTKLFCQALPPPPPDVPPLPPASPTTSTRQRFSMHSRAAECATCHRLMDPIGFGFERFDPAGRYRETEGAGIALSGEGELTGTDVDGRFVGPVALAAKLAASPTVRACVAAHALRFATGRNTVDPAQRLPGDVAAAERLAVRAGAGLDIKALLASVATSEDFLFRDTKNLEAAR